MTRANDILQKIGEASTVLISFTRPFGSGQNYLDELDAAMSRSGVYAIGVDLNNFGLVFKKSDEKKATKMLDNSVYYTEYTVR